MENNQQPDNVVMTVDQLRTRIKSISDFVFIFGHQSKLTRRILSSPQISDHMALHRHGA